MTAKRKQELLRLVARQAILTAPTLQPVLRAQLYEGASLVLPKREADAARDIAFLIREAEQQQASFAHLLFTDPITNLAGDGSKKKSK
jgi:hypothetical protein